MNGFDVIYNGDHSIQIGSKNTWSDWHLIPSSRPLVNPPRVKTEYIDVPGSNSSIDITELLTGFPTYENRTGSWEFIVVNGHKQPVRNLLEGYLQTESGVDIETEYNIPIEYTIYQRYDSYVPNTSESRWDILYSEIMNYLHGKRHDVILNDDRNFIYQGRLAVNQWKSDKNWSTITIDYDLYPFKKERFDSLTPWEWNPFDFFTGIIRDYNNLLVDGFLELDVLPREEPIIPRIRATTNMEVTFNRLTYYLSAGEWFEYPEIVITQKNHVLFFKGNGNVSVEYRGGSL